MVSWSYLLFTPGGRCGIVLQYDVSSPFKQFAFEPSGPLSICVSLQRAGGPPARGREKSLPFLFRTAESPGTATLNKRRRSIPESIQIREHVVVVPCCRPNYWIAKRPFSSLAAVSARRYCPIGPPISVSAMDTGNNGQMPSLNIESIGDVKVLSQGDQAEYGRSSGLQIATYSKSGTNRLKSSLINR